MPTTHLFPNDVVNLLSSAFFQFRIGREAYIMLRAFFMAVSTFIAGSASKIRFKDLL